MNDEEKPESTIPVFQAPNIDNLKPQISPEDYEELQKLSVDSKPVKTMIFELSKIRQALAICLKNQEDTNRCLRSLDSSVMALKSERTTTISWPRFIKFSVRFLALALASAIMVAVGKSWVEGWFK